MKVIVLICLLVFSTSALAQTRSRTTKRRTPPAKTTTDASATAFAQKKADGAARIASQIKSLSRFLYLLGGVANGIQDLDKAAKAGQGSPTVLAQNEKNKATLRASFADFRTALDTLEIYFRSTPELQGYYVKMVGSASGAADAEAQANNGQFDQAGRTLLGVVNRLADVLVAMG
jgi:hypothetical protein